MLGIGVAGTYFFSSPFHATGKLYLSDVTYAVVDEADTMFHEDFGDEVSSILKPLTVCCLLDIPVVCMICLYEGAGAGAIQDRGVCGVNRVHVPYLFYLSVCL